MGFQQAFKTAAMFASPEKLDLFRRHIDPDWIDAALAATGTATVRRRRLPAEQVIWVVLGMAMFRDRSIEDVVSKLDLALPGPSGTIARSSIAQARARVGSEPVKWLFQHSADTWSVRSADANRWRGLSLRGIDGSSLRVPDSEPNRVEFGGHAGRKGTDSGYPLVRIAALMVLPSHILAAANFGSFDGTSEVELTRPLLDVIPGDSLTLLDRGFFGASLLLGISSKPNRHWLVRGKSNMRVKLVRRLGPRDEIVQFKTSSQARKLDDKLPKTFQARRIRYKRRGFDEVFLLTSLHDPAAYPRDEVIALYHQRWEIELGYDEIKTELLEREECIRSQKPDGVRQEIWGILLAYNLVRVEIEVIARQAKVPPARISFLESLRLIRDEWMWLAIANAGTLPKRLIDLRASIKRYVLPERRPKRRFPRAVKLKMSNYDRKRPKSQLK